MKTSSKRVWSRVLSFVMMVSAMCTNLISANAGSGSTDVTNIASGVAVDVVTSGGPVSVWDFGAVEENDAALYTNVITRNFLDNWEEVGLRGGSNAGKFLNGGTFDIGGGLSLTTNANDRLYYDSTNGARSYGDNAKAITAFDDGYTANGMWYANGTGNETKRFFQFDNLDAGTEIKLYTGSSNSGNTMVEFSSLDGAQADEVVLNGGIPGIVKFVAKTSGAYKVWFNSAGGKPIVNRIVKTVPVLVTANINLNGLNVKDYSVQFKNNITEDVIDTTISNGKATAMLTPGYSYTAVLKGAVGYGFTSDTKTIEVTLDDLKTGSKTVNCKVETKQTFKATGKLVGFDEKYDTSKLVLTFVPEEGSNVENAIATLNGLNYTVTLEPDVKYTATLAGVNDYEVSANGDISGNGDMTQDITVALKATYTATGKLVGGADVKSIAFVNVEDGYSYGGVVNNDGTYTVLLRAGSYEVQAVADGFKTSGHIVVEKKDVNKDILFVPVTPIPPTVDTSKHDIYVGCEGQVNNYSTVGEALKAAAVINPQSESDRVTIHIAPGTYREQLSVTTPYITLVPEGNGEVKLSWYYGIGYRYYSVDKTGYYNVENAFDKYEKETEASKWGVGTYVTKTATGFKAENITFEASFNKYITDEEIADGVTATGSLPNRTYALDVTSRAATERSTALIVEGDQSEFNNCKFIGSQDTLYMGDSTHTYYKNCMIEGNTDYIFGSGNAVFDGCELRFCGYSDTAMGGYITAGRSNNKADYVGYLFRACTITNKDGMQHTGGYFGRPWDAGADITFLNTVIANSGAITDEGWTSMSGVAPTAAKYKEFGTTYADGTAVDTSKRVTGVITAEEAAKINAMSYLGWTPTYYVDDTLPVAFATEPYFSTDGDVLLPQTGNTFTVKYSLGANDANDASKIVYSLVKDGKATAIKSTTAAANTGVKLTKDMMGSFLQVTVTPCTILGNVGEPKTVITEKEITLGSGSIDVDRPSGKSVIFLAGDSTVKDYSAGAINNSGANRAEGSWGEFLKYFVDNDKYEVMNYAEGGRSSRTFINGTKSDGSDKFLDKIKSQMVKGDYLFIQFGHNDSSASYADRYVPVGTPDSNGVFPSTAPTTEGGTDGTFKYYLQQYIDAAKAVGATPVMVTPVSRMYFNADGTIYSHHGNNDEYVTATKQIAEENGILCIDLYNVTKAMYEDAYKVDGANGASSLAARLFAAGEKTHHSKLGGFDIAARLAKIIQDSSLGFASSIVTPKSMYITDDKGNAEFVINNSGLFTSYGRNTNGDFDSSVPCEYFDTLVNSDIAKLNDKPSQTTTEVTTEATTEATTEVTTSTPEGVIAIVPSVKSNDGKTVVIDYNVKGNSTGFNNYTMFFTFDPAVLSPVDVTEGNIAVDSKDALGHNIKINASNVGNIKSQFNNVPAKDNNDFVGADGIKTQAQLGKVKVSYCIYDKDFGSAPNGALTKFAGEGTLFTVTYNVTGNVIGTSVATDISVINSVSSDLNIASKPVTVENGSYTFVDETTSESTTEETTDKVTEATTDKVTEATTDKVTEATTDKVTEATTDKVTEVTTDKVTEATTDKVTEVTTDKATEATTEETTKAPSRQSSGAGASSIVVKNYNGNAVTTEITTEATTDSRDDSSNTGNLSAYVKVTVGAKDVVVNDETYTIDVAPYIQSSSNSTMVPLRFVAIAILGEDVDRADTSDTVIWDSVNKTATIKKDGVTAVFTAGSNTVVINGNSISMNYGVVAEIKDSRMFVPFRVIGEALNAKVDWDADTKTAYYNK